MADVEAYADNQVKKIQTAIGKMVKTNCKSKSNSTVSSDISSIKNALPYPTWINGTYSNTLPDGVYKAIGQTINTAIGESSLDKYSTNQEKMVSQIASQIKSGLKYEKNKVTIDKVDYTVTVDTQTFFGIGNRFIDVTWESKTNKKVVTNTVKFGLTNVLTDSAANGIAKFCAALAQLNSDLWKDFALKVTGLGNYLDIGGIIAKALTDKDFANSLIQSWPKALQSKLKNKFVDFVRANAEDADTIIKASELFKLLKSQYENLHTAVSNDKDVEKKVTIFDSTCNELQSMLGLTLTKMPGSNHSKQLTYTNKKKSEVIVPSGYKSTLKATAYAAKVTVINAASRSKAIKITGNGKANTIYGGKGNDTINGGKGNDYILGNDGNDKLYGGVGNDILIGGKGDDSLFGEAGKDKLYGGVGNDTLKGDAGADELYGEAGKDKLYGGTGNDELDGGTGNDSLYGEDGHDIIYGGAGNDKLYGGAGNDVLFGGAGKDTLSGNTGDDILFGDADNDIIYGNEDNDKLYGGTGKDTLDGGTGNDTLDGGAGNDTLFGGAGDDILYGGIGNDTMSGGAGKDVFWYDTGDGNDTIVDYANEDIIWIGNGIIGQAVYSGMDTILTVGKGSLTLKNTFGKTIWVKYIDGTEKKYIEEAKESNPTAELGTDINGIFDLDKYNLNVTNKAINIDARKHNDKLTLYGNDRANVIWAGTGGSSITAGKGNDVIYAGNGRDDIWYHTGDGNDTIYNLSDKDIIYLYNFDKDYKNVSLSGNDVILNLNDGSHLTLKDAKNVNITIGHNVYAVSNRDNTFGKVSISGNTIQLDSFYKGIFRLSDYAANPVNINATASGSNLTIYGDDRANVIWAGTGGSSITAGKGNDVIYAGNGRDDIWYHTGDGNDTIYNADAGDRILFSSCSVISDAVSGSDVVLNINTGGIITMKNVVGKSIYIGGIGTKTFS